MKTQWFKTCGMQQNGPQREAYSNAGLPQESRKVLNTQPNLTPTGAGERTAIKA